MANLAAWTLELDPELPLAGDAGNTEASRPSKRDGTEVGIDWFPSEPSTANFEASYPSSRFDFDDPVGDEIPGPIPLVISSGITAHFDIGWRASAQLEHFGRYPLIEGNSLASADSTLVNLRVGRAWERFGVHPDVINLLHSKDHDVDSFYALRLPRQPPRTSKPSTTTCSHPATCG